MTAKKKTKKRAKRKAVDISPIVKAVQIHSVNIHSSSLTRTEDTPADHSGVSLRLDFGAAVAVRSGNSFGVDAVLRFAMVSADTDAELVTIRQTLRLTYSLPEDVASGVSKAQIDRFADVNGPFNAWPYWREYVHSSLSRMGVPSVVIPVYRVGMQNKTRTAKVRFNT